MLANNFGVDVNSLLMLLRDFLVCYTMVMRVSPVISQNEPHCSSRFDYEYKVVQRLVDLENSKREQDKMIEELMKKNSILETEIEGIKNISKKTIAAVQSEYKEYKVVSVSCFGVIVSVMFHFMFVHYTFSSVWVAEWPPFGK